MGMTGYRLYCTTTTTKMWWKLNIFQPTRAMLECHGTMATASARFVHIASQLDDVGLITSKGRWPTLEYRPDYPGDLAMEFFMAHHVRY